MGVAVRSLDRSTVRRSVARSVAYQDQQYLLSKRLQMELIREFRHAKERCREKQGDSGKAEVS